MTHSSHSSILSPSVSEADVDEWDYIHEHYTDEERQAMKELAWETERIGAEAIY